MLDKQDLQAIREMMKEEIAASEERTRAEIRASEERMKTYVNGSITASEERTKSRMDAGFAQVRQDAAVLMESEFRPQFNLLAENQQLILEKLEKLDNLELLDIRVTALEAAVKKLNREVAQLKKAQ